MVFIITSNKYNKFRIRIWQNRENKKNISRLFTDNNCYHTTFYIAKTKKIEAKSHIFRI